MHKDLYKTLKEREKKAEYFPLKFKHWSSYHNGKLVEFISQWNTGGKGEYIVLQNVFHHKKSVQFVDSPYNG